MQRLRTWLARIKQISPTRWVSYLLFLISGIILCVSIYLVLNIDVLKNWHLVLPKQEIHAGDTVYVESIYTKTVNVSGKSTRYLECRNASNIFIRYPLSKAEANHGAGQGGTGVSVTIPTTIPDLPDTCRVSVVVDYELFLWRHTLEEVHSDTFTLLPVRVSAQSSAAPAQGDVPSTTQTSPAQSAPVTSVQGNVSGSSSNTTTVPAGEQSDISQPADPTPVNPTQNCAINLLGIKLLCS